MSRSRIRRVPRHLLLFMYQTGKGAVLAALPMIVLPSRVAEQSLSPYGWTLSAPPPVAPPAVERTREPAPRTSGRIVAPTAFSRSIQPLRRP
jgi:hypothetical protein